MQGLQTNRDVQTQLQNSKSQDNSQRSLVTFGVGLTLFVLMLWPVWLGSPAHADEGGPGTLPTATATVVPPTSVPGSNIYLPVISLTDARAWRKIAANGQQLNSVTFESSPNQAARVYVGDGRTIQEGGGIYRGSLLASCSGTVVLKRVLADARILDVYFDNERGVAGTFGNKAYYYDLHDDTWKRAASEAIDKNVYSLTSADHTFFAGTDDGIFQSVDGTTWARLNTIPVINVVQPGGDYLWIGSNSNGVYQMSLASGTLLAPDNRGLVDAPSLQIWDIVVADETTYIGTTNGVFQRTAAGAWVMSGLQAEKVYSVEIVGNELFAGLHKRGVFRRVLSGGDWTPVLNGTGWNSAASVQDLDYRSALCTTGALFAATDNGLWLFAIP